MRASRLPRTEVKAGRTNVWWRMKAERGREAGGGRGGGVAFVGRGEDTTTTTS